MIEQPFSLIPFPAPNLPDISMRGIISLHNNQIKLNYLVSGNIDGILLPLPSLSPDRRDELWMATCFEFFLAIKEQLQYWEFNMSPSGDWNVYCMDAYRRVGFREEDRFPRIVFDFEKDPSQISLVAIVDLDPIVRAGQILEVGITSIIQTMDGVETYWALTHPGPLADFHQRESFTLELAEEPRLLQSATSL